LICFDFDDHETWLKFYEPIFDELAPNSVWQQLIDPEDYSSADYNFTKLAEQIAPQGQSSEDWLRGILLKFFKSHFTHAASYHSCRIVDASTFERDGVCGCDIDDQNRIAESLWGRSEALERAISALRVSGYSGHSIGKVGLWFSRQGAISYGDGSYKGGSEYLRLLANKLGSEFEDTLEKRGRPALVRCVLPVEEIGESIMRRFSCLAFLWKLTYFNPDAPPQIYVDDGDFMHPKSVPPENITIEYLDGKAHGVDN